MKSRKLLNFILEKKCRDSFEILEFCKEHEMSESECYVYLHRFTRKGIVKRYWIRDKANRRVRRYCVESVDKVIEKL